MGQLIKFPYISARNVGYDIALQLGLGLDESMYKNGERYKLIRMQQGVTQSSDTSLPICKSLFVGDQ